VSKINAYESVRKRFETRGNVLALRLGKYFGTTPELWMNLQASYDLRVARAKDWPKVEPRVRVLAAG
jgi:plasmid maintenance system antidote protein VapI